MALPCWPLYACTRIDPQEALRGDYMIVCECVLFGQGIHTNNTLAKTRCQPIVKRAKRLEQQTATPYLKYLILELALNYSLKNYFGTRQELADKTQLHKNCILETQVFKEKSERM